MALTQLDRDLLKRCLSKQPGAWNDFVDRFLGLIYHVIQHTAHLRSVVLKPEDTEDLSSEVLTQIISNDYAILRQFRGSASLSTYLTVIARRISVHELAKRAAAREVQPSAASPEPAEEDTKATGLERLEEVERLLNTMDVVNREEFEAVRDMAVAARNANDALERRIAELEAKLKASSEAAPGSN